MREYAILNVTLRNLSICVVILSLSSVLAPGAQAQTFTILHAFAGGTDGANPDAGLIQDAAGNFYGTTLGGGSTSCHVSSGCGTVFRVDSGGSESVLHAFTGTPNGAFPEAALIQDAAGNLYGTTAYGGDSACQQEPGFGCGTVFRVGTGGRAETLYKFTGLSDGGIPTSGLVLDATGNLYGTASAGGDAVLCPSEDCGTVFRLNRAGYIVLHRFAGGADGLVPAAGLVRNKKGNLYGTTVYGGGNPCPGSKTCGTVFMLDKAGVETVLQRFSDNRGQGAAQPFAGLIGDTSGNSYGTTAYGGEYSCPLNNQGTGCGTVYMLSKGGQEDLYVFAGGTDGAQPFGGLARDADGNLYGSASIGGDISCSVGNGLGCGTVFKLDSAGTFTVLHTFTGGSDGATPSGDLLLDANGVLYGTAYYGGNLSCQPPNGCGTVFKLTP